MKIEPFALERFFADHEFQVKHLLCASDCETISLGDLLAMEARAAEAFSALRLGYTETAGDPALRHEIASMYEGLTAADILVFAGAEEAIFVFMNAVLQKGDHLVVHSPCYQSLAAVAAAAGCRVSRWETIAQNGWMPDPEWLSKEITPATRAIVVNFPHNPTGCLPSRANFEQIVAVARRSGLLLFSDEVYRFLEYDAADRLPAACEVYEHGVSLGVMSKAFGLAGLRLGWVACRNHDILRSLTELKDYTTICTAAPSEFLAQLALRQRTKILRRNLEIISGNLAALDAFFQQYEEHFAWQAPKAGPIAFPALRFTADSGDFCAALLRDEGVLLAPGCLFGAAARHFRIGFGRRDFRRGLDGIFEFMKKTF